MIFSIALLKILAVLKYLLKDYNTESSLALFGTLNYEHESNTFQLDFLNVIF